MSSLKRYEGYVLIDHRASPGVSEELVRQWHAAGKWTPLVDEGCAYESGTMTCAHCGTIVILNPLRTRPREYCPKCDKYVCGNTVCATECRSFNKLLDTLQEQAFLDAQSGNIVLTK